MENLFEQGTGLYRNFAKGKRGGGGGGEGLNGIHVRLRTVRGHENDNRGAN